jgi:hypothetical protein
MARTGQASRPVCLSLVGLAAGFLAGVTQAVSQKQATKLHPGYEP